MSTRWTTAQEQAITDRGGTLLVSAAAGSGKTAVMVERTIQMMLDTEHPIAADQLLVVTFTRAAAEELRGRIATRLEQAIAQDPGNTWLQKQRLLLGRANICTIDSYCMQLLRRYFAELEIPPDFTLADDATVFTLRQNALAQTLEEMYTDVDFRAFASLYGRARSDQVAGDTILYVYDYLRSLPDAQEKLEQFCLAYETTESLPQTVWGDVLLQEASHHIDAMLTAIARARALIAIDDEFEKYDVAFASDANFLEDVQRLIDALRWDDALVALQNYKATALRAVRTEDERKEILQNMRLTTKKNITKLREKVFVCTQEEFEQDRAKIAPMMRALKRAVLHFEHLFFTQKCNDKVLEYSDFEHLALRLLRNKDNTPTKIATEISKNFAAVLVDEYQDTNELQALLYRCLSNATQSNQFFVGDAKQSIYRFRLVNPDAFIEKRETFAPYDGTVHPATIVLGHNFRSSVPVIHQINDVFETLMSKELGNVPYDDNEKLVAGVTGAYDGGPMELHIVETKAKQTAIGEATFIAQRITQMVKEGFLVREKDGTTRPCRFDDFCILLRSRARFAIYESVLESHQVQAYADTDESWLTAPEITPVLSLLRVIDNPAQEVALVAVLLSVMFGYVPDDLVRLRNQSPHKTLYAALLESDHAKDKAFCDTLRALRAQAPIVPIETLCADIFARTHYFAAASAMENGAMVRENLRDFVAFATESCARGRNGLAGFLRYVDDMIESGSKVGANAPQQADGRVSIMTIHRSKGLEFPVCILADTARSFNLMDLSSRVLLHPALGIGMDLRGDAGVYATACSAAMRVRLRSESLGEEMRTLYVALTRARDKLIVTCAYEEPKAVLNNRMVQAFANDGIDAFSLSQMRSFSDWLVSFALLHPDCDAFREGLSVTMDRYLQANGHLMGQIVACDAVDDAVEAVQFVRTAQPDMALVQELQQNFKRSAPLAALSEVPVKLSVSAIAHGDMDPVLSRPSFLYKEGLTGAERGTAQHAFLQFADFASATQDLTGEIEHLVEQEYITQTLANHLPIERIETFLQTPLAKRMQSGHTLLREYDFITSVPARFVMDVPPEQAYTPVLVQGIADAVLVQGEYAEIIDYKTDRGKTKEQFIEAYQTQLQLYRVAIEKRLGVKVTACTIYSFELGCEINVPFEKTLDICTR